MFFVALKPLLAQCQSLNLIVTASGDEITVTVIPTPKAGQDKALAQPLKVSASAADLDAGLAEALTTYSGKRLSLLEQTEATTAILEAARQESVDKSSKAVKSARAGSKVAGSTLAPTETDGDEGDGNDSTAFASSQGDKAATSTSPESKSANLFEMS